MTPIRIGLDIAKNVFQVHGVDDNGTVVIRKRLRRPDMLRFFASLPPYARVCLTGCVTIYGRDDPTADQTASAN